jgi:hypothetical protein
MKKLIMLFFVVQCIYTANAQWTNRVILNPFDDIKDKVYCHTQSGNYKQLRLEKNTAGNIIWYAVGLSLCEDTVTVDFAFLVGGEYYRTSKICYVDSNKLILDHNLISSDIEDYFIDSKKIAIRIIQKNCAVKIYNFNTKNSGRALKFIYRN